MKKLLNKLAIWFYLKTKEEENKNIAEILSGIVVIKSEFVPNGTCIMGTGDINRLNVFNIKHEIETKQIN